MSDRQRSMLRNTGLSYAGQTYALLIGILILPFYLGHLGAEAYGLIGFFAVMQACRPRWYARSPICAAGQSMQRRATRPAG